MIHGTLNREGKARKRDGPEDCMTARGEDFSLSGQVEKQCNNKRRIGPTESFLVLSDNA